MHFLVAKRNGHGVHSPFAYRLCEEVFYNPNTFYDFKILNIIRNGLLTDETELIVEDLGASSRAFKDRKRKVKDIAKKGISTQEQSELLYRLLNFLNPSVTIELGTSLGLNSLYLAKVNPHNRVISIEGNSSLYNFAKRLSSKNKVQNIQFINALFDDAFPKVLEDLPQVDVFYVDGNHTYKATIDYFRLALQKKHNGSVFIFDDIYWSKEMSKAWEEIKAHPSVTLSIDTFSMGLIFFREEIKTKTELKFFL